MSPATGSPPRNVRSRSITASPACPACKTLSPGIVHGLELFLEQFVQFSEAQSIRRNADIKSSCIQEACFVQFNAFSVFLFKERFGKGGFTAELIHYSSSSVSNFEVNVAKTRVASVSLFWSC